MPPQRAQCPTREAAIVTITRRQVTTASRNARAEGHLLKDASLKRCSTRESSFREMFCSFSVLKRTGEMAAATQQGVVQRDVCNPLDTGRPLGCRTPTPETLKALKDRSGTER